MLDQIMDHARADKPRPARHQKTHAEVIPDSPFINPKPPNLIALSDLCQQFHEQYVTERRWGRADTNRGRNAIL